MSKKTKSQDLDKSISMAVSTGKVILGYKRTLSSVLNAKVKAMIISNNVPEEKKEVIDRNCGLSNIPIIKYNKSGVELGSLCGRPHKVSVLAIVDPGDSKILEII